MNIGDNLKLSGKGIMVSEEQEWLDDNLRVTIQVGELHEVIDVDQEKRFGWLVPKGLQISTDFTLHTKSGMRGESFIDNLYQVLILDQNLLLDGFTHIELIEVDISGSQKIFDNFLGDNFYLGKQYKKIFNEDEPSIIFISLKPEMIVVQTSSNSVRIGGQGVFVLDREEESLVLISDKYGITVIKDGDDVVEIRDNKSIKIEGMDIDPFSIINHVAESLSEAFSDFDF